MTMIGHDVMQRAEIGRAALAKRAEVAAPVVHAPPKLWRLLVPVAIGASGRDYEEPLYLSGAEALGLLDDPEAAWPRAAALLDRARPKMPPGAFPLTVDQVADKLLDECAFVCDPDEPFLVVDAMDVAQGRFASEYAAASTVETWTREGAQKAGTAPWRVVRATELAS